MSSLAGRGLLACLLALLCTMSAVFPAQARTRDTAPRFLRISLRSVSPDIVTTSDDPVVTVGGVIENFSDQPVTDVEVRLQRAPVVLDSDNLRSSLAMPEATYDVQGPFLPVVGQVAPHTRVPFALSLPLRGPGDTLQIASPGVYPLLVNVNGTPASGARARLDDLRFLLPVLGLPAVRGEAGVPARIDHPTRFGMVLPFADHPRWAAGSIAGDGLVRLVDDELADELAPGGRLDVLLSGLEALSASDASAQRRVRESTCVAVDPDLLLTVDAMTREYLVLGPRAELSPGKGAGAARVWLARLRTSLQGRCVLPLPFAHADLQAVAALGAAPLGRLVLGDSADVVDRVLGVNSTRGLVVGNNAKVSPAVVDLLRANETHAVLVPRASVRGVESEALAPNLTAVHYDSAITALLGDVGAAPKPDFPPEDPVAGRESAAAAVLWPALWPSDPGQAPSTGGLELVVPPAVWNPSRADFDAVVTAATTLLQAGLAKPISWTPDPGSSAVGIAVSLPPAHAPEVAEPRTLDEPFPNDELEVASAAAATIDDLAATLVDQPDDPVPAGVYAQGWRQQLLRVLAGGPSAAGAPDRLDALGAALQAATRSVSLIDPGQPYTLVSEQGSLPVVVRNGLPVSVRVQFVVRAPAGVVVTDAGDTAVPPHGSRSLLLPAQVQIARRCVVEIELRSVSGLSLGSPVTVSVQSGRYDSLLKVVTVVIAALLLALMALRLWRRFTGRGGPGERPRPGPHERRMARLGWKERTLAESGHEAEWPDD